MTITSVHILERGRPDKHWSAEQADIITLNTDLPPACDNEQHVSLTFRCAAKAGRDYVARNFPGIPVEVVSI